MPRGQYDRSKMKKKASKTEDTAAPVAKRPYKRKFLAQAPEAAPAVGELSQGIGALAGGIDYRRFHDLGLALNTLAGLRSSATGNTTLQAKIDEQISKLVGEYGDSLTVKPVVVAVEEVPAPKASAPKANGTVAAAPVAQAPVAFNPPAFTQPQS